MSFGYRRGDPDHHFGFTPSLPPSVSPPQAPGSPLAASPAHAGGFTGGLLARGYGAVDRFLPGDRLLDPMVAAASRAAPRLGGGLRIVDEVLGLGVGDAIDRQRLRATNAQVRSALTPLLADSGLTADQRLGKARQAIGALGARGHDVSGWLGALNAVEAARRPTNTTVAVDEAAGHPDEQLSLQPARRWPKSLGSNGVRT